MEKVGQDVAAPPPGVPIPPELQAYISGLVTSAQAAPEKEPGFWSRATTGLGESMIQVAAETAVVLCVVGLGYLVKVGVEAIFFKDETAGL